MIRARHRRLPRGTRRGVLVALLLVTMLTLSAATAFAGMLEDRLAQTRSEAKGARTEISVINKREMHVQDEVSRLNRRLAELQAPLNELEGEVESLDYRIERRQARIEELKAERAAQRVEIIKLGKQLDEARDLLAARVVAAYKEGDTGIIEQLAGAGNLDDLFAREEALGHVVGLDGRVISRISDAERAVRVKRAHNFETRREIRDDIAQLADDRADVDAKRAKAQAARDEVAGVRAQRDAKLKEMRQRSAKLEQRLEDLDGDAKVLQDVIKNGTSTYSGAIGGLSSSGLIWPVSGPVVSPFGWRWGRPHEGIDIGVGMGTPIHAAASGIVTYATWMSGYGNMVIIQHAGSLSTGYGHQSQIAVTQGQTVTQGQVIGFVGCTGHCFGPHLHFETRINGTAQDPMQYLG
jgi:murein DD-endopeptidase MepM/ murein hydrolase activator NlpD